MSRLIPILSIVFAIAVFFGYISPTYNGAITTDKQQIQSYDSALTAATAFSQKENQLLAEKNAIPAAELTRLQAYMPDSVDNVQLILDLNSLATRSGISLSDFQVADNATSTDPTTGLPSSSLTNSLDLSVSATGTYSAFETFLAAAEQSLRPLDVTEITIKTDTTGVYQYKITFRIYWLQ
jgi:hypothetical protein